ncbi:MAG TPA: 4Fe-4S binding protein [Candidatus Aminicenantes bacterium]|nr:4Fe-4S binding protein [Candidatus Aminicenantes bacterium]
MFLMTGKLHLPVPALILAGPIYRGTLSFMLILFLVTIVLVGPAWCSHLCYVGAWDDIACRRKRRLVPLFFPAAHSANSYFHRCDWRRFTASSCRLFFNNSNSLSRYLRCDGDCGHGGLLTCYIFSSSPPVNLER